MVLVVAVVLSATSGSDDDAGGSRARTAAPATTAGPTTTAATPKPKPKPAIATIEVRDGQPVGGVQRLRFKKGSTIAFVVDSDTGGEVHFHGYDVAKDVSAGGRVSFRLPAAIDGIFEVELEETKTQIARVEVEP